MMKVYKHSTIVYNQVQYSGCMSGIVKRIRNDNNATFIAEKTTNRKF